MARDQRTLNLRMLAVVSLLGATAFAGCLGDSEVSSDASDNLLYSSFNDALGAHGEVFSPKGSDSAARLKVLMPASLEGILEGQQEIVVLLYDSASNEPVTDATFEIRAWMPAMGHGSSPEEAPVHTAHGVYKGFATWSMPGKWQLTLSPQLADGTVLEFVLDVAVGSGVTLTPEPTDFASFKAAKSAAGKTYRPDKVLPLIVKDSVDAEFGPADNAEPKVHVIAVQEGARRITVTVSATPTAPAETLMVELRDPSGASQDTATIDDEGTERVLEATGALAAGEWSLAVRGPAVKTAYKVVSEIEYTPPDVMLKLLFPLDPAAVPKGELPIQVLLFDGAADAPVEDAAVRLTAFMPVMGHGTNGEKDPVHKANGVYLGKTNLVMEGKWILNIDASLPAGHHYEWDITVATAGSGESIDSDSDGQDHGGDGHEH